MDYNLPDDIFISHLHFDHVGGLFMLLQGFWLEARKKELRIHAPANGIAAFRRLLEAGCIFDELLPFRLNYAPLQVGKAIDVNGVRVTPYPTTHLADFRRTFHAKYPQSFEAFCFLLETDRFRIGHSADIGAPDDLAPVIEKPLDLLVCELAHVQPEELFQYLQGREIKRILFIHLSREFVEKFDQIKGLASKMLGSDRIGWPADGQEFQFGPAS